MRLSRLILAGLATLSPVPAAAQVVFRDTVTVVPGADYKAGPLHRLFFGSRYRDLWTRPIRVPVLDLRRFAGGLTPTTRGGGMQTKSVRFRGGDGREYAFRSLEKDPTVVLPLELRETFAADLLRDQMSSGHPAGAVLVPPLLEAVGVLHVKPLLAIMPDDPQLGEFRAEFGGMLGMIEERPRDADGGWTPFAGAREIVSSEDLFRRLERDPSVRVDSRAYLLARLTDVFLGDWDRHRDQWRWALVGEGTRRWVPIPRDRDMALVRFDGLLLKLSRREVPQLTNFGPRYARLVGATWNGRDLDRRLLTDLEWRVWDSTARGLQARLTDEVIARTVAALPPEYRAIEGPRLTAAFRARRDAIPQMTRRYYRLLAGEVDVQATDRPEVVRVVRRPDGLTEVLVTAALEGGPALLYYRRVFDPQETNEVRLLLHGGNDRVVLEGPARRKPKVRAVGGGGDDSYELANATGVRLYDDRGTNRSNRGAPNSSAYRPRIDTTNPNVVAPRDWGRRTYLTPSGVVGPDIGVVPGFGGRTQWYGFRHQPWTSQLTYRLEYSTGARAFRASMGTRFTYENSRWFAGVDGSVSGFEVLRFYGLGNETSADSSTAFYRLNQNQVHVGVTMGIQLSERDVFRFGPFVHWADTDLQDALNQDRFIAQDNPYGTGRFGYVGFGASLVVDHRDLPSFATRGGYFRIAGSFAPGWIDAVRNFGSVQAEGSVALTPRGSFRPTLALMVGARWAEGQVPFFEASYLGGTSVLRGYRTNRFAGDGSVYGSTELRLPLTRIRVVVPGRQGIFGFGDVGRVYLDGERSNDIHGAWGGGVWWDFVSAGNPVVVGAGKSEEGTRLFARIGFAF